MRPGCLAGGAHAADSLAGGDALAAVHADVGEVCVERAYVAVVADDDEEAVATAVPARPHHPAGLRGTDPGAVRRREVEPGVEAVPARAEEIADPSADRPAETEGHAGARAREGAERRRPGHTVGAEAGPALKPAECRVRVRPEDSVEGPGREAVPGELELERGDVPPVVPALEHARREAVAREAPERAACLGAGDAVHGDPGAALEEPYGPSRPGAQDAVDRPGVEASRLQADLEPGDVGGSCARRGSETEEPCERKQRDAG